MKYLGVPATYEIIPSHDQYCINRHGDIIHYKTGIHLEPVPKPIDFLMSKVMLDNEIVSVGSVMAEVFIGPMDLPLKWVDPVMHHDSMLNLTYNIGEVHGDVKSSLFISGEEFRPIPGYETNLVSQSGVVVCTMPYLYFAQRYFTPNHYSHVIIRPNGSRRKMKIHVNRVVYMTWVGPIELGNVIDHKDNIIYHNHWTNLQQVDQRKNIVRSFTEGNNQDRNFYSDETVIQIAECMSKGYSIFDIAYELGLEQTPYLSAVIAKLRSIPDYRSGIASGYDVSKYNAEPKFYLATKIQEKILADAREGYNMKYLRDKHPDVDEQVIRRVCAANGVTINRKNLTPAQANEILEYDKTHTNAETCARFGIGNATLWNIQNGTYFDLRPRGYTIPEERRRSNLKK